MGVQTFDNCCETLKLGSLFCKDVAIILQERSQLEIQYAKSLSKISLKLIKLAETQSQSLNDKLNEDTEKESNKEKPKANFLDIKIKKSVKSKEKNGIINIQRDSIFGAWEIIGQEMEQESCLHRDIGIALDEDIIKPLTTVSKLHSDIRKNMENDMEKALHNYEDSRSEEIKAKIASFDAHRQAEKLKENIETLSRKNVNHSSVQASNSNVSTDAQSNVSTSPADKELARLEDKLNKTLNSCQKYDHAYHDACIAAELARQNKFFLLQTSLVKANALERERISVSVNVLSKYLALMANRPEKARRMLEEISKAIMAVSKTHRLNLPNTSQQNGHDQRYPFSHNTVINKHLSTKSSSNNICNNMSNSPHSSVISSSLTSDGSEPDLSNTSHIIIPFEMYNNTSSLQNSNFMSTASPKSVSNNFTEQNLFDFFAEDMSFPIPPDRRKQMLERNLIVLRHDLEKYKDARESVDHLVKVYLHQIGDIRSPYPNIVGKALKDIQQKLLSCHDTKNHLQASYYKVHKALSKLTQEIVPEERIAKYISTTKDAKTGVVNSVLKIPFWDSEVGMIKYSNDLKPIANEIRIHEQAFAKLRQAQNAKDQAIINDKSKKKRSKSVQKTVSVDVVENSDQVSPFKGCGLMVSGPFSGIKGKNIFGRSNNSGRKAAKLSKNLDAPKAIEHSPQHPTYQSIIGQSNVVSEEQNGLYPQLDANEPRSMVITDIDSPPPSYFKNYVMAAKMRTKHPSSVNIGEDANMTQSMILGSSEKNGKFDTTFRHSAYVYPSNNNNYSPDKLEALANQLRFSVDLKGLNTTSEEAISPPENIKFNHSTKNSGEAGNLMQSHNGHKKMSYHISVDNGTPINNTIINSPTNGNTINNDHNQLTQNKVCMVKYEYTAIRFDELSISPGDILEIFDKQRDGWWRGQKIVPYNNRIGIFPSTYVQELLTDKDTLTSNKTETNNTLTTDSENLSHFQKPFCQVMNGHLPTAPNYT